MRYNILLLGRVVRAWRRRSIGGFSRLLIYNLRLMVTGKYLKLSDVYDQSFDRQFNVETAGTEEPEFLTAEDILKTHARAYEPVSVQHMQALLGMLPALDFGTFMFIDLGSGKGRALFVAAMHPFQQVVGVEYSRELHEIAIRNMKTYGNPAQECFDIRPICADATTFSLPEFPTVCFINNPYDVSLMAKTAELLDKSVQSAPRPFFVIYLNAYCTQPIDDMPGWSRIREGFLDRSSYVIWQWDAASKDKWPGI